MSRVGKRLFGWILRVVSGIITVSVITVAVFGVSAVGVSAVGISLWGVRAEAMVNTVTIENHMFGDVNDDGEITDVDALMALQTASTTIVLIGNQKLAADVTKDGFVTAIDALKIMQYASGQISIF